VKLQFLNIVLSAFALDKLALFSIKRQWLAVSSSSLKYVTRLKLALSKLQLVRFESLKSAPTSDDDVKIVS